MTRWPLFFVLLCLSLTLMAAPNEPTTALDIYSATDYRAIAPMLKDFKKRYPDIQVNYREFNTLQLYQAIKALPRDQLPDVVISSAMDLQVRLVNDGYAQPIDDPALDELPAWAKWRNEAIGFTYEPIVFVYNKLAFKDKAVPLTHESLASSLRSSDEFYTHKVGSYDVRRSALGYFIATQDEVASSISGRLQESLGRTVTQVYCCTSQILDDIADKKLVLGYNMLGSYALARAKRDPRIGVVIPEDYTLVVSRVAFISKTAKHVANAKRFLHYLISKQGQKIMSEQSELIALSANIDSLSKRLPSLKATINFHPIPVGPALMVYLDQSKKEKFIQGWEAGLLPNRK